ncbi:DUF1059 domain-containing protein [Halomicrococcus sp. NG-SE-24]|uniref:DUF1059 domain-containing protein n=1 Tax=Halomicrococcus sp. NG-SE-24 TaxID=3436928 RepID=UPI003D9805F0
MAQVDEFDREAAAADCRFIIQSENEKGAVELTKNHTHDVHGKDYTDEELRSEHLKTV